MKNTRIAGCILAFLMAIASLALAEEYRYKAPDAVSVSSGTSGAVTNALTDTSIAHAFIHSVLVKPTATNSIANVVFKMYYRDIEASATNDVFITNNTLLNGQTNTFEGMVWVPETPLYWGIGDQVKVTAGSSQSYQIKVNWSYPLKNTSDDSTGL